MSLVSVTAVSSDWLGVWHRLLALGGLSQRSAAKWWRSTYLSWYSWFKPCRLIRYASFAQRTRIQFWRTTKDAFTCESNHTGTSQGTFYRHAMRPMVGGFLWHTGYKSPPSHHSSLNQRGVFTATACGTFHIHILSAMGCARFHL